MKKHFPKHIPSALIAGLLCAAIPGHSAVWIGGTGLEYSTAANWGDNAVPASGSTQDINGAFTVERSVDSVAGRTFVRGGGTLNITGGSHNDTNSSATNWNFVGDGSAGTVNQSAGTFEIGHALRVGTGDKAASDGTYHLSGGFLSIYRGSNSAIDSSNPGGRPSMEVGGITNGTGLFEISGGAMETRGGVHIGGTGTFSVVGSAATSIGIGSNQSLDGVWLQTAGGTLSAAIDAGGVTPIFIDDKDGGTIFAEFQDASILDLSFASGVTPFDGAWTVMEVEGTTITDLGLGLSAATMVDPNWSFVIDNSGANGLLVAIYSGDLVVIPEPSRVALIAGCFGLVALMTRRRKA